MPTRSDAGTVLHKAHRAPPACHALSAAAVWPPAGLPGAPLLENASWPATGQLSSPALNQPVRKATVYWMCLNALQLHGRLDQIYTIDLVEACLSVCELPHLRLAQLVESPAAGDDPRRVRERTTNSRLLLCSFHDTDNISSVRLRARSPARLVSWGGAECDIVRPISSSCNRVRLHIMSRDTSYRTV